MSSSPRPSGRDAHVAAYTDPHERHIDRIGQGLGTPQPRCSDDYRKASFKADPIAVVVYDFGSKINEEPMITVFGPFGGWNEAREYRDKIRSEREAVCVVMRDPSIWPEPEKAL